MSLVTLPNDLQVLISAGAKHPDLDGLSFRDDTTITAQGRLVCIPVFVSYGFLQ